MLSGNNLFKQNKIGNVVRITTDDIPEGELNKYDLDYPDGKYLGDIIIRYTANEIPSHKRLNGQKIYRYDNLDFYEFCYENKQKAQTDDDYSFYNKTEQEYLDFYDSHTWQDTQEHYCPYFVLDKEALTVYEVSFNDIIGYTPIQGASTIQNEYIFGDVHLTELIDINHEWTYTGNSSVQDIDYIHLPTIPNIGVGNTKTFYFVVTNSRVTDTSSSIRNIAVGNVERLSSSDEPYVRNVGTIQNLILDFGIPSGSTPTIEVGTVTSGESIGITTEPTETGVKLNFVLEKGERGDAGGVVVINYKDSDYPPSASTDQIFYNTLSNKLYIYKNNSWVFLADANSGMIYLFNSVVHYFDGSSLKETYATIQYNPEMIDSNQGKLEVIGVKSKTGTILYDWIGTLADWEFGRANGTILDNYICYVTDD